MNETGRGIINIVGPVVIRRAAVDDAGKIARVRVDSWRVTYRGMMPDAYLDGMKVEDSTQLWQRVLAASSDAACTFVAEAAGDIIGFAAGNTLAEDKLDMDAELTALYVLPSAQRAGVGSRLFAAISATLGDAGAHGMLTWVLAKNRAACDFFTYVEAQQLAQQTFKWDDSDLIEVAYGWHDLRAIGKISSVN